MAPLDRFALRLGALSLMIATAGIAAPVGASAGESSDRCPVRALDRQDGTVDITFWHVQQAPSEEILIDQIAAFEASQDKVRVDLLNVLTYPDIFEKYKSALTIRVDRSFVEGVAHDRESAAIVAAVVALARALGMTTVAEGVESAEELDEISRLGVDWVQGLYVSPLLPANALGHLPFASGTLVET